MVRERAAVDEEEVKEEKNRQWNLLTPLYAIMAAHCLISYQLFVSTSRKKRHRRFVHGMDKRNRFYRSNLTARQKSFSKLLTAYGQQYLFPCSALLLFQYFRVRAEQQLQIVDVQQNTGLNQYKAKEKEKESKKARSCLSRLISGSRNLISGIASLNMTLSFGGLISGK